MSRIEPDGSRTVLASHFDGKRLNSPNDVVVKSDGSIWFTDPTYGIDSEYEGDASPSEIGSSNVYRVDPASGAVTLVVDEMVQPNGLAFSPDEKTLYVADTGGSHVPGHPPVIRAYPLGARRQVGRTRATTSPPATPAPSTASGWTPAATSGPPPATACTASRPTAPCSARSASPRSSPTSAFGGRKRNRLFVCATSSVFALYVNARGCGL